MAEKRLNLSQRSPSADGTSATPAASSGPAASGTKKTAKKDTKARVEKKRTRGKQVADDSTDSSSMPSGTSTGSGAVGSGSSGQSTGNTGAPSGRASVNTNNKPLNTTTRSTTNPKTAGSAGKKATGAGQTKSGRLSDVRGGGKAATILDAQPAIVKQVIEVQNRNHDTIASQKGVIGTGTGVDEDGNVVIRVYTDGANSPTIPKMVENVRVVEVMTGPIAPCQGGKPIQQQRQKHPVPIGVSIYFANFCNGIAVGTLGCRLKDQNGNLYVLGSNHVLCNDAVMYPTGAPNGAAPFNAAYIAAYPIFLPATSGNNSTIVPTILAPATTTIVQPAPIDENCILPQPASDSIGTLFAFVPFNDQTVPPTPPPQLTSGVGFNSSLSIRFALPAPLIKSTVRSPR